MGAPWLSRKIRVPIYGAALWVGVADDITELEGRVMAVLQSKPIDLGGLDAGLAHSEGAFVLLFSRPSVSVNLIGHEVFHATHRILQHLGEEFTTGTHEAYSYLCGWLHEEVYAQLKKAKVKIAGC